VLLDAEENPHEMGSKKGNVKERRKFSRPQHCKIGSSGWIRTSNPPVNSVIRLMLLRDAARCRVMPEAA
jgi:hypothetical protein